MSSSMRGVTISLTCTSTAVAGGAHRVRAEDDAREFPQRVVTPLCANVRPPIGLELRALRDLRPRRASVNLEVATSVPAISVRLGNLDVGGLAPQNGFDERAVADLAVLPRRPRS